ncbi:Secoisolariciresinol dehydrogenase [Vitis vinifera]|uniref:Secoisolariciresinol dehydrogenase n=1 Tax=Vitis vinifera TaxID=29760 RepID=A0A438JB27_VITVI|nr:Secoisolariciresinol dehydrogenase [Vitis vinifera]
MEGILNAQKSDLERVIGVNLVGGFLGAKHAARVHGSPGSRVQTIYQPVLVHLLQACLLIPMHHPNMRLVGLAKNLAAELGLLGINSLHTIGENFMLEELISSITYGFCVLPYVVSTNIGQELADFTPKVEAILNEVGNLKGTVLKASDVARAAHFLASDEATYVSGLNLGWMVVLPFSSPAITELSLLSVINGGLFISLCDYQEGHPNSWLTCHSRFGQGEPLLPKVLGDFREGVLSKILILAVRSLGVRDNVEVVSGAPANLVKSSGFFGMTVAVSGCLLKKVCPLRGMPLLNPMLLCRLEGKVALITGGASGIGKCTAETFTQHGAKVVIADIQDELAAVDKTAATHGKLDIMFNNAGIVNNYKPRIMDNEKADFERVLSINVTGVFLGMKHAARVMVPAKSGSIISTASVSSNVGAAATHAYCCSKHAVLGLTRNAAIELGQFGIRVNCLSPYALATPLATNFLNLTAEELETAMNATANLKGVTLKAQDVANAALYLASDESRYVSGHNLS